jgi:hypothetical protein
MTSKIDIRATIALERARAGANNSQPSPQETADCRVASATREAMRYQWRSLTERCGTLITRKRGLDTPRGALDVSFP